MSKTSANEGSAADTDDALSDSVTAENHEWQTRYARQIALTDWGTSNQLALHQKRVFIVGLGGLGSPVAIYLAASGVGQLVLNDFDDVDLSNLPRQPLHATPDVGRSKTASAADTLRALNPQVALTPINERLHDDELARQFSTCDAVVDCSDNFGTRFAVNAAAAESGTPLISAAAIRGEGQLAVFRHDLADSPCYRCLYSEADETNQNCQGQGVIGPLVGTMGSMAATAVLNVLVFKVNNAGKLLCFDAKTLDWSTLTIPKNPACPVCSARGK